MVKKRICNIVCDITSGGVESVLLNYFSHMDISDFDLDLITYDIKSDVCAEKFKKLGFNIITVPPKRDGFMSSIRAMDAVIKEGHYDIIHTHLTEWNCIPMFLAWKNKVPIRISHSHMADYPRGIKNKTAFAAQKCFNKMFATKLCACGDDAAKYLYGEKIYNSGRVKVLNNAIDVKKFAPDKTVRADVRKELNIGEETFCVGHIGRFLPQKNHGFLIDIFSEVIKRRPDSCLLLMGQGELEETIHNKVSSMGLEDKVKFLGVRGDAERIYQAMDVFCLPSLFEGLPVVGIEAQAAQLPCVVSDLVSQKVRITENVTFCSLGKDAEDWANVILSIKAKTCEIPSSFNITETSYEWIQLYLQGEMR